MKPLAIALLIVAGVWFVVAAVLWGIGHYGGNVPEIAVVILAVLLFGRLYLALRPR